MTMIKVNQNILLESENLTRSIILDTDQGIYYGISYILKKREENLIKPEEVKRHKLIKYIKEEVNRTKGVDQVSKLPSTILDELTKYHGEDISGAMRIVKEEEKEMKKNAARIYKDFIPEGDTDWDTINTIIENGILGYLKINNIDL